MALDLEKEILELYTNVVEHKEKEPLTRLSQTISKLGDRNVTAVSLCYAARSSVFLEQKDFQRAFDDAYAAYRTDPSRKQVLHSLINLHLPRRGATTDNPHINVDKATQFLDQLVKVSENDVLMLHCCGMLYCELQKYDSAIIALETALKTFQKPNGNEVQKMKEKLCQDLTSCYLERYKQCPDNMNLLILKYLIELLSFNGNTLNETQAADALEEVHERCEFVFQDAHEKKNWSQIKECIDLITPFAPLSKKMCIAITAYFEATNKAKDGIEYYSELLSFDSKVKQTDLGAVLSNRAILYGIIGDQKNAQKDLNRIAVLTALPPPTPSMFDKSGEGCTRGQEQEKQSHSAVTTGPKSETPKNGSKPLVVAGTSTKTGSNMVTEKQNCENKNDKASLTPGRTLNREELEMQLTNTREQLTSFVIELSQTKMRCEKLEHALQTRDEIIADMKLEAEVKKDEVSALCNEVDNLKKKLAKEASLNKSRPSLIMNDSIKIEKEIDTNSKSKRLSSNKSLGIIALILSVLVLLFVYIVQQSTSPKIVSNA